MYYVSAVRTVSTAAVVRVDRIALTENEALS